MDYLAKGLIRPYRFQLVLLFRLLDAFCTGLALWLSTQLFGVPWQDHYTLAAVTAILLFLVCAEIWDMYQPARGMHLLEGLYPIMFSWMSVVLGLLLIGYATRTLGHYPRPVTGTWLVLTPAVLIVWRLGLKSSLRLLRSQGFNVRRVAILGAGPQGHAMAQNIMQSPWTGLKLLGLFDDRRPEEGRVVAHGVAPLCGDLHALLDLAKEGGVDRIYITLPMRAEDRIRDMVEALSDMALSVHLVPDFFAFSLLRGRLQTLGDVCTLSVFDTPHSGLGGSLKRLVDLFFGVMILCMIAVPMLLIAVGVWLSSPGPVLFRQRRYGLDGREVMIWKFRTMRVQEDGQEVVQARKGDSRVTHFGAFLRRTSLDELPQFFNVLQGHMSIVGPRPHAVVHNEQYRHLIPFYMLRHRVKPGITGWAQINGWRGETEKLDKMERRVEHDLWYIRNWSVWLDIRIILLTILRGFGGPHAY